MDRFVDNLKRRVVFPMWYPYAVREMGKVVANQEWTGEWNFMGRLYQASAVYD